GVLLGWRLSKLTGQAGREHKKAMPCPLRSGKTDSLYEGDGGLARKGRQPSSRTGLVAIGSPNVAVSPLPSFPVKPCQGEYHVPVRIPRRAPTPVHNRIPQEGPNRSPDTPRAGASGAARRAVLQSGRVRRRLAGQRR